MKAKPIYRSEGPSIDGRDVGIGQIQIQVPSLLHMSWTDVIHSAMRTPFSMRKLSDQLIQYLHHFLWLTDKWTV